MENNSRQENNEGRRREGHAFRGGSILICGTEAFCEEASRELLRHRQDAAIFLACSVDVAARLLKRSAPRAILAEDRALLRNSTAHGPQRRHLLVSALSLLAASAPVVWVGAEEDAREIAALLAPLAVDFVPRSALCLPAALRLLERRLRVVESVVFSAESPPRQVSLDDLTLEGRDFGEVLRHELNNPLTGILGNAELLLLEVRRGRMELPAQSLQRLEIIADLAVRMRETVRQLSDRWIAAGGAPAGERPAQGEPQWPVSG